MEDTMCDSNQLELFLIKHEHWLPICQQNMLNMLQKCTDYFALLQWKNCLLLLLLWYVYSSLGSYLHLLWLMPFIKATTLCKICQHCIVQQGTTFTLLICDCFLLSFACSRTVPYAWKTEPIIWVELRIENGAYKKYHAVSFYSD